MALLIPLARVANHNLMVTAIAYLIMCLDKIGKVTKGLIIPSLLSNFPPAIANSLDVRH